MAKEYELEIQGQPTRYSEKSRTFKMYFSEPDKGVEEKTNILILIAGYGGKATSNVYQKMRRIFADEYDLVVMQCDYLGYQYMQNDQHMPVTEEMIRKVVTTREFRQLIRDFEGNKTLLAGKVLTGFVELEEKAEDYNEMGLWQAMDHLMALKVLFGIFEDNGIDYYGRKVILYGQSHGAYLSYLCNRLAPGMFFAIIENSAYLVPYYLYVDREVIKEGELFSIRKLYHYLISDQNFDRDSYDLVELYKTYRECQTQIVVFHGKEDEMIPLTEKKNFLSIFSKIRLHEIGSEQVDGKIFRSAGHSLGADFLEVFRMAMQEIDFSMTSSYNDKENWFLNEGFETQTYVYQVNWETGMPILFWKKKVGMEEI